MDNLDPCNLPADVIVEGRERTERAGAAASNVTSEVNKLRETGTRKPGGAEGAASSQSVVARPPSPPMYEAPVCALLDRHHGRSLSYSLSFAQSCLLVISSYRNSSLLRRTKRWTILYTWSAFPATRNDLSGQGIPISPLFPPLYPKPPPSHSPIDPLKNNPVLSLSYHYYPFGTRAERRNHTAYPRTRRCQIP